MKVCREPGSLGQVLQIVNEVRTWGASSLVELYHQIRKNYCLPRLRALFLSRRVRRVWGVQIGRRNIIEAHKGATIELGNGFSTCRDVEIIAFAGARIKFDDNTYVGHGSTIAAMDSIYVGEDTMIADLVSIRDHNHGFARDVRPKDCGFVKRPIVIGRNCWIAAKATIVAGVTLGDNVVVGANSVVTKSFGSNVVIAGCPAAIVGTVS